MSKVKVKKDEELKNNDSDEVVIEDETEDRVLENTDALLEDVVKETNEEIVKNKKDGLHKYTIIITIISIVLFVALAVFSTIFALLNINSNKIVSGISIQGIDVSNLTYDDAKQKVSALYEDKLNKNLILQHNEQQTELSATQIEGKFDIDATLNIAYGIGRSGKVLKDNYTIINTHINKLDITPSFIYNEKILTDFIQSTSDNLQDKVKQSSYSIDGTKLKIYKGEKGFSIKVDELKNEIVANMADLNSNEDKIEMPVEEVQPDPIDLQKIHDEIYKEAQDAYYIKNPFTIYPHVNGIDFAISMEEANALLNNEGTEITIPLKITKPKVTTNQIGTEAFPDLIASYSTTFATSNSNRANNIRVASNKINGVVLLPGEEFSYNKVVGKRTVQAGFKEAGVYMNGKVETDIGGGICQVSSTLYNTALRANLQIVKRSNHYFDTGYVPLSTDATVSWGGPEFIFKNSRKYPVKIVSVVNGGKITISIYGCKEEVEYEVIIKSETLQRIPMKTEYRINTSLPQGTQKVVQKGHGGYKSRAYRILKLNGKVVSTQLLSTDTYAQLSTIIEKN